MISSDPTFNKEEYVRFTIVPFVRSSRTENSLFFSLEIGCQELEKTRLGPDILHKTEITARIIRIIPSFFIGKSICVNRTYHSTNEGSLEITL